MPQLKLADSADSAAMQKEKEKGSQKDGKRGFGSGTDLEEQAYIPTPEPEPAASELVATQLPQH